MASRALQSYKVNTQNVLVIGDIHEPFCLKGYFEFCVQTYKAFNCTHALFIGDTIDNHATSFHDPDPDLHSPADELERAQRRLQKWHEAFPYADVCTGNHEARVFRIATKNRISRMWVREYAEVLNVPTWNFQTEFIYDNVRYVHGDGSNAERRALVTGMNTVCGDKHTQMYVKYHGRVGANVWAVQTGCGLDRDSKAAAYAIHHQPQAIGCAVILNHGALPVVVPMRS